MSLYPDYLLVSSKRYAVVSDAVRTLPAEYTFIRVLHERELPPDFRTTPPRMPEVRPFFDNHHVPFGRGWQLCSRALNPLLSDGNWTAVYHYRLWIANNQGFGIPGDPRANYVENTSLDKPLPRVEALTCGGNVLRVLGEKRTKTNRGLEDCYIVETLDYRHAAPSADWLRPWLVTWAVRMREDGTPVPFPQGQQPNGFMPGVRHPLLADPARVVCLPKWRAVVWTEGEPPDPYTVYLPV